MTPINKYVVKNGNQSKDTLYISKSIYAKNWPFPQTIPAVGRQQGHNHRGLPDPPGPFQTSPILSGGASPRIQATGSSPTRVSNFWDLLYWQ